MSDPFANKGPIDPFKEVSYTGGSPAYPPAQYGVPQPATATSYPPSFQGAAAAAPNYGGSGADGGIPSYPTKPSNEPMFYDGASSSVPGVAASASSAPQQQPPQSPSAAGAPASAVPPDQSPQPTSKFWTFSFYQQFFDVTTYQVLGRISNAMIPVSPPDFLIDRNWHYSDRNAALSAQQESTVLEVNGVRFSRNPDMYGPFWICTTLWMTIGIISNIMSKISFSQTYHPAKEEWVYDFSVASVACIVIYLYCFVFGAAVWGCMMWKNLPAALSDTVCLYGYSMFVFVLVCILCMIPVTALQWIFVCAGGVWSLSYLLLNFWHMWKATLEPKWFIAILTIVSAFHIGLTLSFKLYFFHYML